MKVGVPREIKNHEYRVANTPSRVHELVQAGHHVFIETAGGEGSSISDDDYITAGATILPGADDVWATADLILKVKEPIEAEYHRMRSGQVLTQTLGSPSRENRTHEVGLPMRGGTLTSCPAHHDHHHGMPEHFLCDMSHIAFLFP